MSWENLSLLEFGLNDVVLFLGEGNFSFSRSLITHMQTKFNFSLLLDKLHVSCYERELSNLAALNVNYLKNLGAEVILGLDATKLDVSPSISSLKFDKVIFNFPHIGGKMKIHLNRELLKNFFVSVSKVLSPDGVVVVTLCAGQGGTGFETVVRRWDDTWQITSQAGHGQFILFRVSTFPHQLFPDYSPVGYRGMDKKFNTASGVIHCFRKADPVVQNLSGCQIGSSKHFHNVTPDLMVSYIHKRNIDFNPLNRPLSPQLLITKIMKNHIPELFENCIFLRDELPLFVTFVAGGPTCLYRGNKYSMRQSLFEVVEPTRYCGHIFAASGLVFKKCYSDFSDLCTRCHFILNCPLESVKSLIYAVLSRFEHTPVVSEEFKPNEDLYELYLENCTLLKSPIAWGRVSCRNFTFDIDLMCAYIFNVSIRQLWCADVTYDAYRSQLILPCLYPLTFTFDVSFASKKELDIDYFYYILHQLPDDLIESVEFISSYQLPDSSEISYCYRLSYKSYSKPLNREIAIDFHKNVLGKALTELLDVRIR